jgi:hypothetical protein
LAVVDFDDDDGDGIADGRQSRAVPTADLVSFPAAGPLRVRSFSTPGAARVVLDGNPLLLGTVVVGDRAKLQALLPGRHTIELENGRLELRALQILALDGERRIVDFTSSHASFQRTPPDRLDHIDQATNDPDALRYLVVGHPQDLPDQVRIESRTEDGIRIDELRHAKLVNVPCPDGLGTGVSCRSTWPIRVVADAIDQAHPLVVDRSIRGELGGGLTIHAGTVAQQIRIGGPRRTKHGPIRRLRGDLTLSILRTWPGGAASLHARDEAAVAMARDQFEGASALWHQCGITFGPSDQAAIRIVDPPPPFLIAVGCNLGLPSSGGRIRLLVDGKNVNLEVPPGHTPEQTARRLAREIEARGLRVTRSSNARIGPGTFPVVDLLVRRNQAEPARVSVPSGKEASTDPTMPLCIGHVDLAQGLRHFLDVDSMTGTVEERTLLKWIDDGDPSTLEGVFLPAFASGGRIGESFIGNDRSSLRNLVLVDRAGVAASGASHTLAHELGHVLLDVPGHPDDYGVDKPTLLMDSDAANPTAFGPRRLTVPECERAFRQSGPKAPVVLLRPWPWKALAKPPR